MTEAPMTADGPDADAAPEVEGGGTVDAAAPADSDAASSPRVIDRVSQLEAEGDIAADYLEELLDIADLDGDIDMDVEGDRAAVSIVGAKLDVLVGDDGGVLDALQELTRLAVYRETGERSRLMLDVGGYRADLRKNLVILAQEAIEEVRSTGEAVKLAPMTPFERKVVHDAVGDAGLKSESEGVEPSRCVVILPTT
jgi:spoIIIJ-associated protein